ncbi:hypothetical protein CPB83DRAFT_863388 [Crepidotus variabilis]|uniref:FAD-binding domain-containing protein n=1 Tax=Crepidotus variabilis TaxID=179855 RepID=A0A9P6E5V3_9AGAR|nr:hypothetical protein CPB83DRAFT_863388 [Crepidotus variabilis]
MSAKSLQVLISGAGIGGPVAAYWLAKAGHDVTVIERAPMLRKEGQTVDIRKEGLKVIEWMGIRRQIDERTTKEAGIRLVDTKGKVWAAFPQTGDTSFTSEVEIVRGELAMLFYEISKSNVKYIFGTTIHDFTETDDGVNVTLKSHSHDELQQEKFDIIIAAEGLYSRTRAKAFQEDIGKPIHSLNAFSTSFSLPADKSDTLWASATMFPKKRAVLTRPDGFGRTRVTINWFDQGGDARAIVHPSTTIDKQKEFVQLRFQDVSSWNLPRLLKGLAVSDDLYSSEIGQTKTSSWSRGRVVLLGDTAYCPSAMTGMGTTAAIVGAYVLAAEIVRQPADHAKAFKAYDTHLRSWIEQIQQLSPGVSLAAPSSRIGVGILYWVVYVISLLLKLGVGDLMSKILIASHPRVALPPVSTFDTPAEARS